MRLKLLTNLNTLLLVAVCLALGATLWWSQQALERPFLLMERYLSLSQQFHNTVARNIEDYLASGDALRLSDANSALDTLKSELTPLPPALADALRPSLENLSTYSNSELLAAGKLAGDPQALLLQAERELSAGLEQLGQYASDATSNEARAYLPLLFTASQHLAKLSLAREKLVSSGRSELAGDVERELDSIELQARQIDALPLLGVSSKSASGTDDFAAMMGLDPTETTQAEDAGIALKRELNSLLSRYPAELKRTRDQIEQRSQLSAATHLKLNAVQQAIAGLEPVVRAEHGQIQNEVRLIQGLMIGLILLIALLIDTLQRKLARVLTYLAPLLSTWAEGDFSRDIQLGKTNRELRDIEASLNRLRSYLVNLVGTLRLNAEQVAGSSRTLAELSSGLHSGAERQAGDSAQIRDALGELEATIS
ncbi:methyl-accepting chemotaxis protein, partial [Pseudomonas sp.]